MADPSPMPREAAAERNRFHVDTEPPRAPSNPPRLWESGYPPMQRLRFGGFEVDLGEGELRRRGLKLKLHQKPFRVLALLLERAGHLVYREELRQRLWPEDTFVDFDANLNTALSSLRRVLGDSSNNPFYIETAPRQGYRFIAHVIPIGDSDDATPIAAPESPADKKIAS
jgi:DNA-binding winged helix-turn-helix (wHTH) protein